ncbi:MAG: hypothetical protein HZC55_18900 [Verrucomicrobia bacterium]|nr:hypothetical protein [Verrucomicrobiota bacterium]
MSPNLRSRLLAATLLLGSGVLLAHTVRQVRRLDDVHARPAPTPVADAAEATARWRELAGRFTTGDRPGDRVIVLHPDGRVEFSELGRPWSQATLSDRAEFGHRGRQPGLWPGSGGVIEIRNLDTLVYYQDTYRRRR